MIIHINNNYGYDIAEHLTLEKALQDARACRGAKKMTIAEVNWEKTLEELEAKASLMRELENG